ncbi:hypothetical protein JDV02_009133 [Purpureocillium takamizusanense]|uniref:Uncharacterized protein n=1 Tax=Purpureocillium takamizusanense TaxID=2060973 RepID=A0A9Q8QPA7_9HYPO|nr:uncharacterized protein JDV02_009133 [Purpureocillium takamizusanense]UNI23303.1 hypothetical protein JDV02_009133 [Purpureocillium takamizusanense]
MDDMDWAWPFWKFGMKKDDLYTTLHDRYNTFTSTIQDPEAFHHDVFEISHDADTAEQFHGLLAARRQQRLRELNESLEALAVEIIANPKLIGTEQWQHALQLFRTRSYDSIVRYFASYLPEDHLDHLSTSSYSSFSEADSVRTVSTKASSTEDAPCSPFAHDEFFPDGPIMTVEPCTIDHESCPAGPLSPPESEAMHSDAASSPSDSITYSTNPPSRSMSFSGSESGLCPELLRRRFEHRGDDETSQSDSCDTTVTSVCDSAETRSSCDCADDVCEDEDEFPTAQFPDDHFDCLDTPTLNAVNDTLESDTPTPRQECVASSYLEFKSVAARRLPSPHRRSPSPKSHVTHREAGKLAREVRRSPEEASSKIQKPLHEALRKRPKGRRRVD